MASTYNTEPPPTAFCTLHTTAGPITFSLFAQQAPLASRNFLQHILDGYYDNSTFHRVVPGFVIQGGDPTGTGEGGSSIYEDAEFEHGPDGEKVVFGDELHSRLRFNRRGLLGMAKMETGAGHNYGSQFFVTLGDCRAELDGKCTMFGRVEGEGIYNVVRIAEGELVEGTERPAWPVKITRGEVVELPKGESWQGMKRREKLATRTTEEDKGAPKKRPNKKKGGKALLSFGGEEGEDEGPVVVKKAKFNTSLIDHENNVPNGTASKSGKPAKKPTRKRLSASPSPSPEAISSKPPNHHRKPSLHDPSTQLPLPDPESPRSSPSPSPSPEPTTKSALTETNAAIAALKASMRRDVAPAAEPKKKKSALEQLIPETSIRGRKRRHDGTTTTTTVEDDAMKMFNMFKARLEGAIAADTTTATSTSKPSKTATNGTHLSSSLTAAAADQADADEEEQLCDLHFIVNCQSCKSWLQNPSDDTATTTHNATADDDPDDTTWMTHVLSFEKDRLGKDLTWKRKGEEELVVIDPREKEREIKGKGKGKAKEGGREWDRDREVRRRER